jgi:hypothetical protein
MKLSALASASAFLALVATANAWQGAQAQPSENPNMGHFYMARRQITITDDAPAVNDQRTNPQAGAAAGPGAPPGMGRRLPKAGWTPYSQFVPGLSTNLPKTNNGVPVPVTAAPADPAGMRGRAGKLKSSKSASSKSKAASNGPPAMKTYTPYKGYGAPPQMVKGGGGGSSSVPNYTTSGSTSPPGISMGSGSSYGKAETNVRGSVLNWARARRKALNP